jgi:hypothetical protein
LATRHLVDGELMPRATVVFLETGPDGTYLYRYTAAGDFVGDTWHLDADEAREQARFEYQDDLGPWTSAPDGAGDLGAYAVQISASPATG